MKMVVVMKMTIIVYSLNGAFDCLNLRAAFSDKYRRDNKSDRISLNKIYPD